MPTTLRATRIETKERHFGLSGSFHELQTVQVQVDEGSVRKREALRAALDPC